MGERLSEAAFTRATICWYMLCSAGAVARTNATVCSLTEPDSTGSPWRRSTGRDSPVIEDSSNQAVSTSSRPSTGTTSPGRTMTRSPTMICSTGTSMNSLSLIHLRAVLGARFSRAESSRWARLFA